MEAYVSYGSRSSYPNSRSAEVSYSPSTENEWMDGRARINARISAISDIAADALSGNERSYIVSPASGSLPRLGIAPDVSESGNP